MDKKHNRPVHLNLLKISFPVTAILSILHRISGVVMALSLPLLIYLFARSLESEEGFRLVVTWLSSPLVRLILLIYIWFFVHHFVAGIRFLLLDLDIGVLKHQARRSAYLVNLLSVLITLVIAWGIWA